MNNNKKSQYFHTAAYIRLSREDGDREESESIGNQRKLILNYLKDKEEFILHDIYIDDGFTGTNFNRPEFNRMIAAIESGEVDCVIVKDLSRFGRDYIDTGKYLERYFPDHDVRFISITDNIDSAKQSYDMLLPIKNIFNEQYARDISKKVCSSMRAKQNAGEFIGAFPSYGYRKSPSDKNKLVIDDYAAAVVRKIFSMYLQGMGKQSIARQLNAEGIPCPSEYKRLNGENYKNSNRLQSTIYWTYATINKILHNEMYIGNMVQGTKRQRMRGRQRMMDRDQWIIVKGTHEPIIDREIWARTQSLLGRQHRSLDLGTNKNLFAGFLKCADCGRSMTKNAWRLADGSSKYSFYCTTYKRGGRQFCSPHALPLCVLENIVLEDLRVIIHAAGNLRDLIESQGFGTAATPGSSGVEIVRLKTELAKVQQTKKSLYTDYKEELISREELISYREDYNRKEELLTGQITLLEKQKSAAADIDPPNDPWIKRLLESGQIEELDRNIIIEMIDHITVYENRKIKIYYNFSNRPEYLFADVYRDTRTQKTV